MPSKSYGQDLISQSIGRGSNQEEIDRDAIERNRKIEMARKSNFQLGESGQTNGRSAHILESSSRAAYDAQLLANNINEARSDKNL